MRRLILLVAALAIAAPSVGHAGAVTVGPPWQLGPSNEGADSSNQYMVDESTGQMTLLRLGGSVNGSLGCGAFGPFANFEYAYPGTGVVNSVSVHYDDAIVDPYTWMFAGVYQDGHYVDSIKPRGPILGEGDLVIELSPSKNANVSAPVSGPFTVVFGLNVASACPNVDGGTATFSSVTLDVA